MADTIDGELADLRGRTMEDYIQAERQDAYDMGDTDPGPPPARLIDMRGRIPRDHPAHPAVDRALAGVVAGRHHQAAAQVGAHPLGIPGQGPSRARER
jgi:hypothetical protein